MADSVSASLERWLATRTPGQLATLIRCWRPRDPRARDPQTLAELARRLVSSRWVAAELASLNTAGHQILLVADLQGDERETSPSFAAPARPRGRRGVITYVDREDLLAGLGVDLPGDRRDAALRVLDELAGRALMWPDGDDTLVIPWIVRDHVLRYELRLEPPSLALGLPAFCGDAMVERIAQTLGLVIHDRNRWELTDAIATRLSDEDNVRRLVASLPDAAQEALFAAIETGELTTDAFAYSKEKHGNCVVEPAGNDDHVMLLDRALVIPFVPGTALVPAEVFEALTLGAHLPFTPAPTRPLPSQEMPAANLGERVRLAITHALSAVDLLLAAVAAPRAAQADLGLAPAEVPLWAGLAREAGLIGRRDSAVLPTPEADRWRDAPAASRAAQLLRAWQRMAQVSIGQRFDVNPRLAFAHDADTTASVLRHAILRALATVPVGRAVLPGIAPLPAGGGVPRDRREPVYRLLVAASWFAPLTVNRNRDHARLWQTLCEAELLGVTALGTLTDLGRTLLDATMETETEDPLEAAVAPFVTAALSGTPLSAGARVVAPLPREQDNAALLLARRLYDRAAPPPTLFD